MASVSETNTETTLQLYANPLLIQDKQLSLFEEHVFDGKSVLDGNNVFTFGLEMGATLAAGIVNEMVNNFQSLYPSRSQTMSDLYRHLSDYDYVDMFSTPATTTIELMFERNFLIDNAPADEDEDGSSKVIIPEFSTFTIGNHTFGIHYPIEIKIRKAYKNNGTTIDYDKCMFSCIWNTETVNPLYRLTTNILEHRMFSKEGLNFLCISIPIHQFKIDIKKEDSISSTGFIRRYTYSDRFYAIRIFHFWGNQWVEIAETLSDVIYNPQVLTAKVKVLSDIHTIEVSIPQAYYTEGIVGNRIMCMIYTTEGALDIDIRNFNTDQFGASFLIDDTVIDDTYSAFLKRIPMLKVVPLASRISNGSNGKTFEEMKNRVMNSVGGDDLLVTPKQLEAHLEDTGFKVSKYIDNITDRIYIASKELTDSNKDVIGSGEFSTRLTTDILTQAGKDKAYDTIIEISSNEYLILPTTIFKYDTAIDSMVPLSRYDRKNLFENITKENLVRELNSNTYTFTPFHIKLSTKNDLPLAGTFDLLNPKVSNISFVDENRFTSTQLSMYGSVILHYGNGSKGYKFTIALYKTDDIAEIQVKDGNTEQLAVILRTINTEGILIYMKGTFIGVNNEGRDLIEFDISTDYKLTNKDTIDTTCFIPIDNYSTESKTNFVHLTQDYELLFFAHKTFIADTDAVTESNNQVDIPNPIRASEMVWLATQQLTITLGESVSSVRNNVFMSLTGRDYKTYGTTEFAAYITDLYKRYDKDIKDPETGIITHYAGELMLDDENKPIIDKHAGSLIIEDSIDNSGIYNPACIIKSSSKDDSNNLKTTTETLHLDTPHLSTKADPSNRWYPFRTIKNDTNSWNAIYTGSSSKISVIKTKDMLKWIIESIISNPTNLIVSETSDLNKVVNKENGKKYITDPIAGSFVFVNNASSDKTVPTYKAFSREISNGNVVSTKYILEKFDSNSDTSTDHGALYIRKDEYSNFDYTPYLTEEQLCSLFEALNANENLSNKIIQETYNIDSDVIENIKRFRNPWVKLIETQQDYQFVISEDNPLEPITISNIKKNNENIDTYPAGFIDIAKYWINREDANFNGSFEFPTNGTSSEKTLYGLEALAYIQERSLNPNSIIKLDEVPEEGLNSLFIDDRLVWVDHYDISKTDSRRAYDSSLITDLAINEETDEHAGALLWRKNETDKHYVVITGPSFIKCYNHLMTRKTSSGYVYETSVYNKPDDFLTIDNENGMSFVIDEDVDDEYSVYQEFENKLSDNDLIERYISIVPTIDDNRERIELLFPDVIWQHKWPWDMTNWVIDKHSDSNNIGKSINSIGISLELDTSNKYAKVLHYADDVILDEYGKPAVESNNTRKVIYNIDSIHCDYKLTLSDDVAHNSYREDIENLLRGYFDLLESTRPLLLERTNLFFTPIKTLGYGVFKGVNGDIINHQLDVSVNLRVHISPVISGDMNTKNLIRSNIIKIIEQHMSSGNVSCTILAEQIRQNMSDTILYVDVLGIDGNHNVQTLVSADTSQSSVRLKSILVINEDNTISVEKAVNIEWAVMQ